MNNPIPLQFLVGLTRLISIYYCIRAIDQLFGAIMNYQMMKSMVYDNDMDMPSSLMIYIPGLLVYVVIAIVIWFAAPQICRIAIPPAPNDELVKEQQTCWNEVMIFLVGTLFVGIGITRLSSIIVMLYASRDRAGELGYEFGFADKTSIVTTVLLIGFGVIFMKKFPSIHRWIQAKSKPTKSIQSDEESAS